MKENQNMKVDRRNGKTKSVSRLDEIIESEYYLLKRGIPAYKEYINDVSHFTCVCDETRI
jgi:hypothetical protein